uniref:Uncharacterized protein n=1 Tax=Steinernema glaseri TaxID=37863 RepID=A0A1I8AUZ8_9BILA
MVGENNKTGPMGGITKAVLALFSFLRMFKNFRIMLFFLFVGAIQAAVGLDCLPVINEVTTREPGRDRDVPFGIELTFDCAGGAKPPTLRKYILLGMSSVATKHGEPAVTFFAKFDNQRFNEGQRYFVLAASSWTILSKTCVREDAVAILGLSRMSNVKAIVGCTFECGTENVGIVADLDSRSFSKTMNWPSSEVWPSSGSLTVPPGFTGFTRKRKACENRRYQLASEISILALLDQGKIRLGAEVKGLVDVLSHVETAPNKLNMERKVPVVLTPRLQNVLNPAIVDALVFYSDSCNPPVFTALNDLFGNKKRTAVLLENENPAVMSWQRCPMESVLYSAMFGNQPGKLRNPDLHFYPFWRQEQNTLGKENNCDGQRAGVKVAVSSVDDLIPFGPEEEENSIEYGQCQIQPAQPVNQMSPLHFDRDRSPPNSEREPSPERVAPVMPVTDTPPSGFFEQITQKFQMMEAKLAEILAGCTKGFQNVERTAELVKENFRSALNIKRGLTKAEKDAVSRMKYTKEDEERTKEDSNKLVEGMSIFKTNDLPTLGMYEWLRVAIDERYARLNRFFCAICTAGSEMAVPLADTPTSEQSTSATTDRPQTSGRPPIFGTEDDSFQTSRLFQYRNRRQMNTEMRREQVLKDHVAKIVSSVQDEDAGRSQEEKPMRFVPRTEEELVEALKAQATSGVSALGTFPGLLVQNRERLLRAVKDHVENPRHKQLTLAVYSYIAEGVSLSSEVLMLGLEATDKVFRTVFTEIMAGLSLQSHRMLYLMQTFNGANLGEQHFERTQARQMTWLLGEKIHYDLLERLKNVYQKQKARGTISPMSLILDGSSDTQGNQFVVFLLRFIEENEPILALYRIMPLEGETADDYLKTFLRALAQDQAIWRKFSRSSPFDLKAMLMDSLLAVGSDGASSMIGQHNGFAAKLNVVVGRYELMRENLILVHCLAHRLDLIVKPTRKEDRSGAYFHLYNFVDHLEKDLRKVFNPHAPKRLNVLRRVCGQHGIRFRSVRSIFEVRWSSSLHSALRNTLDNYAALVTSLDKIAASPSEFQPNILLICHSLSFMLKDPKVYASLLFFMDLLTISNIQSKIYQSHLGSVIELNGQLESLFHRVNDLLDDPSFPGTWTERLVNSSYVQCRLGYATRETTCGSDHVIHSTSNDMVTLTVHQPDFKNRLPNARRAPSLLSVKMRTIAVKRGLPDSDPELAHFLKLTKDASTLKYIFTNEKNLHAHVAERTRAHTADDLKLQEDIGDGRDYPSLFYHYLKYQFDFPLAANLENPESESTIFAARVTAPFLKKTKDVLQVEEFQAFRVLGKESLGTALTQEVRERVRADMESLGARFDFKRSFITTSTTSLLDAMTALQKDSNSALRQKAFALNSRLMWKLLLSKKDVLGINMQLETLIESVLVLPVDTAEVERVFSLFNMVKTPQRSSLSARTLEATLRVRMWASPNYADFDPRPFSVAWIAQGHNPADDSGKTSFIASVKKHIHDKVLSPSKQSIFVPFDEEIENETNED